MGQVAGTGTVQNDQLAFLEQQSHCITVPDDGDAAQPGVITDISLFFANLAKGRVDQKEEEEEEKEAVEKVIQFTPLEQQCYPIANPCTDTVKPEVIMEVTSIVADLNNDSVEQEKEDKEDGEQVTNPGRDTVQPEVITEVTSIVADLKNDSVEKEEAVEQVIKQFITLEQQCHLIANPGRDTVKTEVIITEVPSIVADMKNDSVEQKEEKEVAVVEEVLKKEVISEVLSLPNKENDVVGETVRTIGPYTSIQKILLVGEGDFSFSTSLAKAFDSASNMIATSLDTQDYLETNYGKFPSNKRELENRGCMVIHGVDATKMIRHSVIGKLKFDIIIYNFPHNGNFDRDEAAILENQKLVRGFMRCAKKMMNDDGEIHITHKTTSFYRWWNIQEIGRDEGLHIIQETEFVLSMFPGYHTKYGYRRDQDFQCDPSKTFKFGLRPKPI